MSARLRVPVETLVALALEGRSLSQIAAATGITRQAISWRLKQAGLSITQLRGVPCVICGGVVPRAKSTAGIHACGKPRCKRRAEALREAERRRVARAARPMGQCRHCGKAISVRARYCRAAACAAAAQRERYHTIPAVRDYAREYQRWRTGKRPDRPPAPLGKARGTRSVALAVLEARGTGSERHVAARFGLSRSEVNAIWRGRRWAELQQTTQEARA